MVNRKIPRVHAVILPVLRASLPGVKVGSWVADVDTRTYPIINVRRLGGLPSLSRPDMLDKPVIELTAYSAEGLVPAEDLLMDAMQILYDMADNQTVTSSGYLHSYQVTMGPTQFDSGFDDTWRVQSLIQLGVRPPRTGMAP